MGKWRKCPKSNYVIEAGIIYGHEIAAQAATPEWCARVDTALWCERPPVRIQGEPQFFGPFPFWGKWVNCLELKPVKDNKEDKCKGQRKKTWKNREKMIYFPIFLKQQQELSSMLLLIQTGISQIGGRSIHTVRAVASLTVPGGQEFHFPQINFSYFSSNFAHFLPHFGPPGGRLSHPERPWLRHCTLWF